MANVEDFKKKIFIGTSGFVYDHWSNGVFYPPDIPKTKWFEYYSQYFNTVEINSTFYRLPSLKTFSNWYNRTPKDFVFVLKGSRYITHIRKLTDCLEPVKTFFKMAKALKEKLVMVLWQLPPGFSKDKFKLNDFSILLKRFLPILNVFEFRNKSWFCREIYDFLQDNNLGLCHTDWPGIPKDLPLTSSFLYLRRHGSQGSYSSSYSSRELKSDASKILKHNKHGKEAFVFFNNDAYGYAIKNAMTLKDIIGLP